MNLKQIENKIWIIADNRPGTFNQSIALAESLGCSYEIIKIKYNFFIKIPNIILQYFPLFYIDNNSKLTINKLINQYSYIPRFIISAGRRSSLISLYLKKFITTKLIQIMNPNISFNKFDFVIIPNHDKYYKKNFDNVVFSIGSLTRINKEIISIEQRKFKDFFEKINKKIIVLLIGGNSKNNHIKSSSIKYLCKKISKINNKMNTHLIIVNSRRTPKYINKLITTKIKTNYTFFNYNTIKENPYLACLGYGDYFVVTGDSVSMISEACSTGKAVFIFDQNKISSAKHRFFHQQLIKKNYAHKFNDNITILPDLISPKLQEAHRIASFILSKLSS